MAARVLQCASLNIIKSCNGTLIVGLSMMYGKAAAVTANSGEATPIMMSSSHID